MIGHSSQTPNKQVGLAAILRLHLSIVKAVLQKHPYYRREYIYVDANAGRGDNPDEGVPGSPVIFLQAAQMSGLSYFGHFIDHDPGSTSTLATAVAFSNKHQIYTGDNRTFVPYVLSRYPRNSTYGLIYHDPNGIPNYDMLAVASEMQPRMDILIRYAAMAEKRNGASLIDSLPRIKKETWIVREIMPGDKWQWTFLFGSNYTSYPEWHKYGFHRVDRNDGRKILLRICNTNEQLAVIASPLFDSPSEQARARSGGICERCSKRRVTEVHHLRYGNDVTADDIVAVCHQCHCELEGVKD